MEYDRSSSKEKWTIMMYMRDFKLMTTYAYALRSSSKLTTENINDILIDMERKGIYIIHVMEEVRLQANLSLSKLHGICLVIIIRTVNGVKKRKWYLHRWEIFF